MKKIALALVLILLPASTSALWAQAKPAAAPPPSLYKRLGGYDAIAAVTDEFIGRLATDKQEGRFFVGLSTDSKTRVRQHVVDFLCAATAHTGLGITDADWDIAVAHLVATLDKFKVPAQEKNEVLTAVSGLKKDIVGK
jgi:hemoglobin